MIRSLTLLMLACTASTLLAQTHLGSIERLDPAFDQLIPRDAKIEILADGFTWTEGPVWLDDDRGGSLLFSDIPRNSIFRWRPGEGVSLFMMPSGYTGVTYYGLEPGSNGLALSRDGQLLACEHGDRRVSLLTKDGGKLTLADRYQGKRLNSPNDLCLTRDGVIYFTDPPYGLPQRFEDPRRELDFCGVYRLTPDGEVQLVSRALERPNGIGLSPDEKTLYVAQSDPRHAIWMSFPVQADGGLGEGTVFYDATDQVGDKHPGLPDGLEVDKQGHLWASGPGGIYVFAPSGKLLGRILTGQRTSNCTIGGPEGNELYMTVDMFLCRVKLK